MCRKLVHVLSLVAVYHNRRKKWLFDVFARLHWRFLRDNSLGRPEYVDNEMILCYYKT